MNNKKTISKLFEDNINSIYDKEQDLELSQKILETENKLLQELTPKQKELFNNINELKNKRRHDLDKEIFIYGFSICSKLIIEGLEKE